MKQKMKNAEELKASPQKFIAEVIDVTNLNSSLYTAQSKGNYKNKPKQKLLQG